jgi:hypothetical protein
MCICIKMVKYTFLMEHVVAENANRRIPIPHKYPLGIEPRSLMTGSRRVDHWTSGTVYECCEIAGSPQCTLSSYLTQEHRA